MTEEQEVETAAINNAEIRRPGLAGAGQGIAEQRK